MTRTEHFCDRCKVRIEADRTKLAIECGPLRGERPGFDLCLGCARALVGWLDESEQRELDGREKTA